MPREVQVLTTAGTAIGLGHLRRCLALAGALREHGAEVSFAIVGDHVGQDAERFEDVDQAVNALAARRHDVLVVDAYSVHEPHLEKLRGGAATLVVLDDQADRSLPADVVLNASPAAVSLAYRLAPGCRRLFGPAFALLARGFAQVSPRVAPPSVAHVLVTLGGSDPRGLTAQIVAALLVALPTVTLDVVIGPLFGETAIAAGDRVRLHHAPSTLLPLMAETDLAVTGGGQTTYELAACGIPAVALCLAENQRGNLVPLAAAGTLIAVDELAAIVPAVVALAGDRPRRQQMSEAGRRLVDGRGAERAAASILEPPHA
jgi:UDP-2,4-diacetamido-2,4,6-trideoxy-beta-L-altropyranose hydrolase